MKYIIFTVLVFSSFSWSMHHKKFDPIIFAIDFGVIEGKEEEAINFTYKIAQKVRRTEPGTLAYEYYFSKDGKKMFLFEIYKNNKAAEFHVREFQGSKWEEEFFSYFELKNFTVLGNSKPPLKKILKDYTTDFRKMEAGFHKIKEKIKTNKISLD